MKNLLVFIFSLSLSFCQAQGITINTKFKDAVPVLNFGTFHMGDTPDATKTEFDEYNKENVRQIHKIAKMLAEFKPTVIIVEQLPAFQEELEKNYLAYLADSSIKFEKPNEIELLAYEIGRLSETKRIYGVDYKEGYKYNIFFSLKNKVDSLTYLRYGRIMDKNEEDYLKSLGQEPTLLEMLKMNNHPDYLDFLININADMLTYASTQGKSEGADEAAKFYHRNLVMFSNINQIKLSKDDRVFILMGATHTAFFKELMKRSPRYNLVNVFDYLK